MSERRKLRWYKGIVKSINKKGAAISCDSKNLWGLGVDHFGDVEACTKQGRRISGGSISLCEFYDCYEEYSRDELLDFAKSNGWKPR